MCMSTWLTGATLMNFLTKIKNRMRLKMRTRKAAVMRAPKLTGPRASISWLIGGNIINIAATKISLTTSPYLTVG